MTVDSEADKKNTIPHIPLLLRIVSILILVEGVMGVLFFIVAGIFQLNDAHFIANTGLHGLSANFYSFYIILHIVLFSGFVISGLYLLRLRRIGYYLFIINYLIATGFTIYLNDIFAWTTIVVGLAFIAVLTYYFKKLV